MIMRNFNEDILRLVFAFVTFVGSVATSGSVASSVADSGVGSSVGILSKFFYWKQSAFKAPKNFFSCTRKQS